MKADPTFEDYERWLHENWTPFWERFHEVSTRYPRRVTEAYEGNLKRAMADSDEDVAATVAEWEREHDVPVRDWPAIGAYERDKGELPADAYPEWPNEAER